MSWSFKEYELPHIITSSDYRAPAEIPFAIPHPDFKIRWETTGPIIQEIRVNIEQNDEKHQMVDQTDLKPKRSHQKLHDQPHQTLWFYSQVS